MRVRTLLPVVLLLAGTPMRAQQPPDLIPAPVDLQLDGGSLDLRCPWVVNADAPLRAVVEAGILALHPASDLACFAPTPISFQRVAFDTLMPPEWHQVQITGGGITVTAPSDEGLYRGSRTLIQLLEQGRETGSLPCLTVTDHPRFPWRGMHLDACRHFWSVEFTKTYIDLLARYKMNRFHWHLTDDQGWRIEIRKYPKLTEVGAWRRGSQVGPYSRRAYDSIPYGGFYTQEQIREVVAYAAARHITVVPEIEMPGHAMAALAAYPRLGCTGGPYEVQRGWGVFDDVFCAGNDSVFTVMQDVLTEVMDLFSGTTIHIGGDECPKERWKTCVKCQARMKTEGLKDEHELQSYFIQRIEKFVNSKGRTIIGWDEILEGGLAPNAAVMSWRGTEGGVAAAKSGHFAVMSPGSHCYFDHYQGDPANEPLAIGGHTTVQKVYSYEPIPAELNAEEAKYILGAQGNVWTEYILTPEHVEYMAVPRMLALAEVLWTPKENRDEADFLARLEREFPKLEAMGVNASKSLFDVGFKLSPGRAGEVKVVLKCPSPGAPVVLDNGTAAGSLYTEPVIVTADRTVVAICRNENGLVRGRPAQRTLSFNLATARPITLSSPPNERYNEGGAFTLVDGITAQEKRVNTEWLGWREGVTITVDLGSEQDLREVGIGALNETYSWIHLPERVEISVSTDGKTFTPFGSAEVKAGVGRTSFSVERSEKARYVRLAVKHRGQIPEGFPGAGNPAWMFLDEIEVR
ncbi:MAG: family 20 glycosylhydrolase [Flavobacteriales bacterium]|nr:family 20 glycosylhydrolase [Flavobacteriales bacterium]